MTNIIGTAPDQVPLNGFLSPLAFQNVVGVDQGGTGLNSLGTSNQVLKVNSGATALEYGDVDSLPSQTGNSGKYLTTDGTTASWDVVDISSEVTGTLPVANGGTGATTLTANNVILGNGTSAVQVVAPGASGNVLTSDGTTWQSTAPATSGISTGKAIAMAMIFGF